MQHLEFSGEVLHIYIYIYVIRRLKVKQLNKTKITITILCGIWIPFPTAVSQNALWDGTPCPPVDTHIHLQGQTVKKSNSHECSTLNKMTAHLPRQNTSPARQQRNIITGNNPCSKQAHFVTSAHIPTTNRPASWSSGQSFWLLITRSRVRFPALPLEFSL